MRASLKSEGTRLSDSDVKVSVVIPSPDDRGQAMNSIGSFLKQSLPAEQVEVIVPANGSEPALEQMIDRQFPRVRLTRHPGATIPALYNAGVAAARGRYVFITEMHVVADESCLTEALKFVDRTGLPAAICASEGINLSRIAEGEQRVFENDIAYWRQTGKSKVTIRGFLIERHFWQAGGGLIPEFGHFAELLFGRRLKELGCHIGYADEAIIRHCNQVSLSGLLSELIAYGRDEAHCSRSRPELMTAGACREWKRFSSGQWSRWKVQRKLAAAQVRRKVLQLALLRLPLTDAIWHQLFLKHWQTSIEIGRLEYISGIDEKESRTIQLPDKILENSQRKAA